MRAAQGGLARARAGFARPKLWRATAVLAALLLCTLVAVAAQGSITVLSARPVSASPGPTWAGHCTGGEVRTNRRRLAYCARVDGRVLASTHGPSAGEAHVAVISDFHLVQVLLPVGARTPSWGSEIVAVGPLLRARNGQREIQAFSVDPQ
jgi:hypothetical protein